MNERPLPPGPLDFDDEGDPLPLPAANSDLADLIQLLEYARRKHFRLGPMVRVGKIALQVGDLRQAEVYGKAADTGVPDPGPWVDKDGPIEDDQ